MSKTTKCSRDLLPANSVVSHSTANKTNKQQSYFCYFLFTVHGSLLSFRLPCFFYFSLVFCMFLRLFVCVVLFARRVRLCPGTERRRSSSSPRWCVLLVCLLVWWVCGWRIDLCDFGYCHAFEIHCFLFV